MALAALVVAMAAPVALAEADPFDTARYDIGIKQNAAALALVDSGQFEINQQTGEGYTLLHYAADAGNLEMVKALLARGADPTLKSNRGSTAFDMASATMVKAALAQAARNWTGPVASGGATTPPAPGSVRAGGNGMCAAIRAEQVNDGRSPALRPVMRARDAIWYNKPDELTLLLEDCVGANARDNGGWTLLMSAASRDRVDAARILLAHGANCALGDESGETPASLATSEEMKAVLAACPNGGKSRVTRAKTGKGDKKECQAKYLADAALCSDLSCKLRAQRKWQQCLDTGRYW